MALMTIWKWTSLKESTALVDVIRTLNVALKDLGSALIGVGPTTGTFTDGATAVSIYGAKVWACSNTAATNISVITGKPGNDAILWATNGNTTLVHSVPGLVLKSGANVTLGANSTMLIASIDGINFREV